MDIFLKKAEERKFSYFKTKNYPYAADPEYPIIHGLKENGDIDWDYWINKDSWTLEQAIAIIDKMRGDCCRSTIQSYFQMDWKNKIKKVLGTYLEHNLFSTLLFSHRTLGAEQPGINDLELQSEVYPQNFVIWAYQNEITIPGELRSFFTDVPSAPSYNDLNTLSSPIDLSPFLEALEYYKNDSEKIRRGITAALLKGLGLKPEQIYLATHLKTINADLESMKRKGHEFVQNGRDAIKKMKLSKEKLNAK